MLRNMEYVYAVFKAGSFSLAAEKLYLTQPCLSAMVKKAEEQLGVPIFDRKTKPLALTEYGVKYIEYIEKMQKLESEFEQYLNDVRGLKTGNVFIGANNVLASYVLPEMIRGFAGLYPGVQVQMTEGNIKYLEDALLRGSVDMILDNCPMDKEEYEQILLGNEHLLLAVHKSLAKEKGFAVSGFTSEEIIAKRHLKNEKPAVKIKEMANLPFIALREGNDTRYRLDKLFRFQDERAQILMEVDQLATAYNIACSGLGATLVSDTLLNKASPNDDLIFCPIDSAIATRGIYLYFKRSRYVTLAMEKFISSAREYFE